MVAIVRPSRAVTRSRSCSAALRLKVSASTDVGVGAAVLDAVDDRLDQRGGLAGAGAGQHQQRPARVVDDALLVVVERAGRATSGARAHQAVRSVAGELMAVTQPSGADSPVETGPCAGGSPVVGSAA